MNMPALRGRRVLLDSNLLVLLCVGMTDVRQIRQHKRLGAFDPTDFGLLKDIVDGARGIVTTPNVMTETSNLARQIRHPERERISTTLRRLIGRTEEVFIETQMVADDPAWLRLGTTDTGLLRLLGKQTGMILVTADHDLHIAAALRSLAVVNFNHLRAARPDFI